MVNYNIFVNLGSIISLLLDGILGGITSGGKAYHDRNATMNPSHEKKKNLPQGSTGFNTGIDLAFRLTGLTSGAATSSLKSVRPHYHVRFHHVNTYVGVWSNVIILHSSLILKCRQVMHRI